jgi:hypothetical protein
MDENMPFCNLLGIIKQGEKSMPTAAQVFEKYNPTNPLNLQWVPIKESHTRGIDTTYDQYGRPVVQGGGSSSRVVSHQVTVRYTGPENIGERLIRQVNIPNYWADPEVRNQANNLTNTAVAALPDSYVTKLGKHIKSEVTWKNALLCLCCLPCAVISCLFTPCLGVEEKDREQRAQIFNENLEQLASDKMVLHMAAIVAEADQEIGARIKALKQNQSQNQSQGGGNIVLTPEQFQMLLNRTQGPAQLARNDVPGGMGMMLPQYQQHGHQANSANSIPPHAVEAAVGARAALN